MNVSTPDDSLTAIITAIVPLAGVRAGSALVRVGGRLLLAQDDEYTLFWLHVASDGDLSALVTEAKPLQPGAGAMAKAAKPDFEAAAALPDGRIIVIGSGSAHPRRSVVLLDRDGDTFEVRDAARIYDLVAEEIGHELNIEGVVPIEGGLRLFHRGNSGPGNVTIDLAVDPDAPETARLIGATSWDLGSAPGASGPVALTFTDAHAAAHPDGSESVRHWYLAAAEDTPNAIDDGPVVGAAIGWVDESIGSWTYLREVDGSISVRKAEGLVVDPDASGAWIVTDPDDEHLSAELCRVELTGWTAPVG